MDSEKKSLLRNKASGGLPLLNGGVRSTNGKTIPGAVPSDVFYRRK